MQRTSSILEYGLMPSKGVIIFLTIPEVFVTLYRRSVFWERLCSSSKIRSCVYLSCFTYKGWYLLGLKCSALPLTLVKDQGIVSVESKVLIALTRQFVNVEE